jgi:hypothetical protein
VPPGTLLGDEISDDRSVVSASEERRQLDGQVVRLIGEGLERRKLAAQARVQDLVDVLRPQQIAKPVFAEVADRGSIGQGIARELVNRL